MTPRVPQSPLALQRLPDDGTTPGEAALPDGWAVCCAPRTTRRPRVVWLGLLLAIVGVLGSSGGCTSEQYVKVRRVPKNSLFERVRFSAKEPASPRTMQLLRQHDLVSLLAGHPRVLLEQLQASIEREPTEDKLFSFAELSNRAGKRYESSDPAAAFDYYGASVAYAYLYLFDERFASLRNPYDPHFRGACDLYNGALEGTLRLLRQQEALMPGECYSISTAYKKFDCEVVVRGGPWQAEDFERFEFVSDYDVQGLRNQYHGHGLGVPLIAVRKDRKVSVVDRYYPPELSFPVTAFLRLLPDENGQLNPGHSRRAVLELYDPLAVADIEMGDKHVPLESDLTTPLAYFLRDPRLNQLATYGLIRPDRTREFSGLYMLEPYDPKKIPVVMVHGLWSSPLTWTEMFNDLRSEPTLRENYQIWFYLYPTGQPFWTSAAQMRNDLAEMRQQLDPERRHAALDQMVLVGHSMGGLVSRMQTIDSRDDFWRLVSHRNFDELTGSDEDLQKLQGIFFFEPNPSVRRVVSIGTPHRGSRFANDLTQYVAQKLIRVPEMFSRDAIVSNNPDVFHSTELVSVKTSVDSLAPDSPILPAILQAQKAPWVTYHNVVGLVPEQGLFGWVAKGSDGVVSFASAHLEEAATEVVVTAHHSQVHSHPLTVLEVRRILLAHLAEMRERPYVAGPPTQQLYAPPPMAHMQGPQTPMTQAPATQTPLPHTPLPQSSLPHTPAAPTQMALPFYLEAAR